MKGVLQDLRYASRLLVKNPGFTTVAVLTLALGIGVNAVVFCWLQTIVLDPLPGISDPARVVAIVQSDPNGVQLPLVSYPELKDMAAGDAFAGFIGTRSAPALLELNGRDHWVSASVATANIFEVLGVRPEKGRTFVPEDDAAEGGSSVVVISDGLWQREFARDPAIVGRTVRLNRHEFTIVGVAPPEFRGVMGDSRIDLWAPLAMHEAVLSFGSYSSRTFHWIHLLARLRQGASVTHAQAALTLLSAQMAKAYPESEGGVEFKAFPLWKSPFGEQAAFLPVLRIVFAMAGGILLIVIANVSCLLLSRAANRQTEVTVRVALGAGRFRLMRQFLTESLTLALVGGVVGLLFAVWAVRSLKTFVPAAATPFDYEFRLTPVAVAFAVALAIAAAVLFGLAPALMSSRADLATSLKGSSRSFSSGGFRSRTLRSLVVTEVALALMLLIGAGLCVKGFRQARRLDLGFDPHGVLYAGLDLVPNGYSPERARLFDQALCERLLSLPGVTDAALVNTPPLGVDGAFTGQVEVEGREARESESRIESFVIASPGYLSVMRIPLLEGRDFQDTDDATRPNVAIVNDTMARRYWPGLDPVGRRFSMAVGIAPIQTFEVVGVARTAKYNSLSEPSTPLVYVNYLQRPIASLFMSALVRTRESPELVVPLLRDQIHALDPAVEPLSVMSLEEYIQPAFLSVRVAATLLVILSAAALALAAIGLYGVISYAVSQRSHEIGVRLALGAQARDTVWMILKQGMTLVAVGVGVGQIASLALSYVLARFLYGVSATDSAAFVGSAALLCLVALLAAYIPARRAMRVDPMVALRYE
ncbi:MAG TPA: ABC transporter permease [Candidatus Acidoferrum sp.]|nr:ABC transporter permease [Candidatus Acidoferrum sp.]